MAAMEMAAERWSLGSLLGRATNSDPITGLEPTISDETPRWNKRVSLDQLRDQMERARLEMDKTERDAVQMRARAEAARDAFEVARDDLLHAIEALNLFPNAPPPEVET
jgi:hypothetical protein